MIGVGVLVLAFHIVGGVRFSAYTFYVNAALESILYMKTLTTPENRQLA